MSLVTGDSLLHLLVGPGCTDVEDTKITIVTSATAPEVWERMNAEIGAASFVAIDTEFTGIGNDQDLHAKDMSARYKAVRKGVQSHGLFEIGLSMWRRVEPPTGAPLIPSGPLFTLRAPQKPTSLRAPLITTCDAFLAACTARPPARSYPSEAEGGSDGGLGW